MTNFEKFKAELTIEKCLYPYLSCEFCSRGPTPCDVADTAICRQELTAWLEKEVE